MINGQIMQDLGKLVDSALPEGFGFSLIVFSFGDEMREFKYVSNAQRSDMIGALEALLTKWKSQNIQDN